MASTTNRNRIGARAIGTSGIGGRPVGSEYAFALLSEDGSQIAMQDLSAHIVSEFVTSPVSFAGTLGSTALGTDVFAGHYRP